MFDLLSYFEALDLVLLAALSLFGGLMLRRWYGLAWMMLAALVADFTLPLIYNLISGDGWPLAWALASNRYVDAPGGVLIWRIFGYFVLIGAMFGIKLAWSKR